MNVEDKLVVARTKLILEKPFLGALVLRLPMKRAKDDWCKTTATDAKYFYYNYDFINQITSEETQFVLAHEALHCALSHFARRAHRKKMTWDAACDFAINPLLKKEGMKLVPGSLILTEYQGMTAEEIYPMLDTDEEQNTLDQHVYDTESDSEGGNDSRDEIEDKTESKNKSLEKKQEAQNENSGGDSKNTLDSDDQGVSAPPALTAQEIEDLSMQWRQRLAGATQQAIQAGKMGAHMTRAIDFMLQPKLPWRMLLARYLSVIAREDYSYTRPSSRRGEPAIFPSLRSSEINIGIVLDTSGSINNKEINAFVSEINAIKGVLRAKIILHACDHRLAEKGPWVFEAWDEFTCPKTIKGGGGTSFIPVFDWVASLDQPPNILVYFTDADGSFPKAEEVSIPVIWLVKGKKKVPFGERIQLN